MFIEWMHSMTFVGLPQSFYKNSLSWEDGILLSGLCTQLSYAWALHCCHIKHHVTMQCIMSGRESKLCLQNIYVHMATSFLAFTLLEGLPGASSEMGGEGVAYPCDIHQKRCGM